MCFQILSLAKCLVASFYKSYTLPSFVGSTYMYCIFVFFRVNFIFANSVERHIFHVKNLRLWHDLPTSEKDKVLVPFRKGFISAKIRIREVSRK